MYQNSKLVKLNDNVETTMIWGSMWDRTLMWLAESNIESGGTYGKSYAQIMNSSDWGNYSSDASQATGNNETWKANNIYDSEFYGSRIAMYIK